MRIAEAVVSAKMTSVPRPTAKQYNERDQDIHGANKIANRRRPEYQRGSVDGVHDGPCRLAE